MKTLRQVQKEHQDEVAHYQRTLDPFVSSWLDLFIRAYSGANKILLRQLGEIIPLENEAQETLTKRVMDMGNERRRDVYENLKYCGWDPEIPANYDNGGEWDDQTEGSLTRSRYSHHDYMSDAFTEDDMVMTYDLLRKLNGPNYGPYGDRKPVGVGDTVKICINNHYYQNCKAQVLRTRPNGEILVQILDKKAPTGHGHKKPKQPVYNQMWVSGRAIKRIKQYKVA